MWSKSALKVNWARHTATGLRWYSSKTCDAQIKTYPIDNASRVLRHLHFTEQLPFERGLQIQEKFVQAQLDVKELHAKVRRRLKKLQEEHPNGALDEKENEVIDRILDVKMNPMILTFEFQPTYTGGKRIKKSITQEEIARYENFSPLVQKQNMKPKFVQVERGGQVTFHGPGQVVAFIILDLKTFKDFPAKCFVSSIENATIQALANTKSHNGGEPLGLHAMKSAETGVWVSKSKKIASIGVHVRRSVTSHGIAINVCPDLSYMNNFEMCGLSESSATSVQDQKPEANVSVNDVANAFVDEFAKSVGIHDVERTAMKDIQL